MIKEYGVLFDISDNYVIIKFEKNILLYFSKMNVVTENFNVHA